MECCIGVSTETVLQMDKFYTVVKRIFKLTFQTVVLRQRESKDYTPKRQFKNSFHYGVELIHL